MLESRKSDIDYDDVGCSVATDLSKTFDSPPYGLLIAKALIIMQVDC